MEERKFDIIKEIYSTSKKLDKLAIEEGKKISEHYRKWNDFIDAVTEIQGFASSGLHCLAAASRCIGSTLYNKCMEEMTDFEKEMVKKYVNK